MREIKFRAWDRFQRKMLSFEELDIADQFKEIYFYMFIKGQYTYIKPLEYTGLKDKNGVEIYEGDILHQDKFPTPDMKIEFKDGCFVGVSINKVQELNWEPSKLIKLQELEYEVIGNIYENPELLEGLK